MNPLDIIVLIIIFVMIAWGAFRGFLTQLVHVAALIVGFLMAKAYYEPLSGVVQDIIAPGPPYAYQISAYIAFFAIFFVTVLVLFFLAFLARNVIKKAKSESYNRFLGGLFGAIKGVLLCAAIFYAIDFWPDDVKRNDWKTRLQFKESTSVTVLDWIVTEAKFVWPSIFEQIEKGRPASAPAQPALRGPVPPTAPAQPAAPRKTGRQPSPTPQDT